MQTEKQQAAAAKRFADKWKGRGYEKGDSQIFWAELLSDVFGIHDLSSFIHYEEQVKVNKTNFIDVHLPQTKVIIEQKSLGKDLRAPIKQSDGSLLTPFQQAKRYNADMPYSQRARWIIACNFAEFLVYDMERPNSEPEQILLENLGKEYYRLHFLVDSKSEHLSKELQVSMKAGEIVGRLYDKLIEQYINPTNPHSLKSLNILCVRLVFCLYAEDAGIFGKHDMFHDFLNRYSTEDLRKALMELFNVLNTPIEERDPYLREDLLAFPYVNGGLFADELIEIPRMNDDIRQLLLQNASLDFDWSEISPTIFGAVFESTLNPETRRSGGMHYTSIENIHKVIDPLFMNELNREFNTILEEKVERVRSRKLETFQDKLASLSFLDPSCGSGNFLTETFISLRRLENEVIRERYHDQTFIGFEEVSPIKVSIQQFYGIEINDFAVTVATTALWISEAQMLAETEKIIRHDINFLPLKSYSNIREGNALMMDWGMIESKTGITTVYAEDVHLLSSKALAVKEPRMAFGELNVVAQHFDNIPKPDVVMHPVSYDYIMGNPPFVGARQMSESQKRDMVRIFGKKWKNVGNMDYVCCWYSKAWQLIKGTMTKAAFVSTNSICQGEQTANLWKPLMDDGLRIHFAYRTFRWDSESSNKAHVHCVIVGFSDDDYQDRECELLDGDKVVRVKHINAYLMDAPEVFVESRQQAPHNIPEMIFGNMPNDGGNLILTQEERDNLFSSWNFAEKYIRSFVGAEEFLNKKARYCLWLLNANPSEVRQSDSVMQRIENVKRHRASSTRLATKRMAEYPMLFGEVRQPMGNFIIVPRVSSERRRYVPMGFMSPDVIASDAVHLIPDAELYHFGVLESNVHMAWMRAVGGRLKSDYRYSKDIVYNNFPWPNPSEAQRAKIEKTAMVILDARKLYPDSSLADLYDELTMPKELLDAHRQNDRAVMEAYGFPVNNEFTESLCVAELLKMYQALSNHKS